MQSHGGLMLVALLLTMGSLLEAHGNVKWTTRFQQIGKPSPLLSVLAYKRSSTDQVNPLANAPRGSRQKRFTINLGANVLAAVAITGIRYAVNVERLYFTIFGNRPKDEREAMENRIKEVKENVEKLEKDYIKLSLEMREKNSKLSKEIETLTERNRSVLKEMLSELTEDDVIWLASECDQSNNDDDGSYCELLELNILKER